MSIFIPAAPGFAALFLKRDRGTGFARREVIGWKISDTFNVRAYPVTLADTELMPAPDAVRFPDGHVESTDGLRAWPDTIAFRSAMDREARAEFA